MCVDSAFDPKIHVSRYSPLKSGFAANGVEFGGFFAPSTKTKPRGEWICWMDSGCECNALTDLQNHQHLNQNLPVSAPLFAFETADNSWVPMKRSWFMDRCNDTWATSLIPKLTGHSFCIGGTTHHLLLGINPFIVMVQGRWKSDAFLSYWKNCKQILPLFISSTLGSPDAIISTMNLFKCKLLASHI